MGVAEAISKQKYKRYVDNSKKKQEGANQTGPHKILEELCLAHRHRVKQRVAPGVRHLAGVVRLYLRDLQSKHIAKTQNQELLHSLAQHREEVVAKDEVVQKKDDVE